MKRSFIKLILVLAILLQWVAVSAQDGGLSVIGNTKGVPGDLKIDQLKSILKGEKQRWGDGTKVVIALMKTNTPIGTTTCKKVYNMSGNELNKFWLALVFQGKAEAPTFFNSTSDLEAFVMQTPGAIGILATGTVASARTVNVDGKKSI